MADERKIGAFEIDRLFVFLDDLQASGYTIDPRQYLALSDLLMVLIVRGDTLDELPLKTLIAPLICSSPAEQQDFYRRFDRWYETLIPVRPISLGERITFLQQELPQKRRWKLPIISRKAIIWVLIAIVISELFIWLILNSGKNNILLYVIIIAFIGFAGWLSWRLWTLYWENQYITRTIANQEPVYTKVPVKAYIQDVMPVMQFKPIVSALRKRTQVPSSIVDVDKTIENALNRDNWLEIVYRQRQVMPEYVVLVDRKSRLDQQARFVQEVLARLAADGVWLHQYEFDGDPRICFPLDRKDTPLLLKDLQSRHPDSRLLIFSGTNELINPLTGLLQDWLESLSYWHERAILTPDKLQKALLEELQSRDFAVLPMTFDGLASLVRTFETDNTPMLTNGGAGLPSQLIERPMRWTGRAAPPEVEMKALVDDVKNYLGENGFYWLCATAVYPELRWELTLHLGSALIDDFGQSLLNLDLLIRLARLPWFRFGYMPDWIRLVLIRSFTPSQENNTREILSELLSTAYKSEGFDLAFAHNTRDSLRYRTRRFIEALIRNSSFESALHDYIFIKFIAHRNLRKLALQLPVQLRKFLLANPFSIKPIKSFSGLKGYNGSLLHRFTVSRIKEVGRYKSAPTISFSDKEISILGKDIYVANSFTRLISSTSGFYLPLPPNAFGVMSFPDGTSHNMKAGIHDVPPGLYKLQYVDKNERCSVTSPVSEISSDGEKITLKFILRYRVIDPVIALQIERPVETLINHVDIDVAQYIRVHDHNDMADSAEYPPDSKFLSFFIQRHNRRLPLSRAFIITGIELKDFIGDNEYIQMRRKARMDERQNKIEREQTEYQQELNRKKALYRADNEKYAAEHMANLERKIAEHKAEIEQMEAKHKKEKQEILHAVYLREIELDDKRRRLQMQEKEFPQVIEAISQTFNNEQRTPDEDKLRQAKLREITLGNVHKKAQGEYLEKLKAAEAIIATYKYAVSVNKTLDQNILDVLGSLFEALGENEIEREKTSLVAPIDNELEDARRRAQKQYELRTLALDEIIKICKQAYSNERNLKVSETRKIDRIHSTLKRYKDFPLQEDKVEKLAATLRKLLSPKSSDDKNKD